MIEFTEPLAIVPAEIPDILKERAMHVGASALTLGFEIPPEVFWILRSSDDALYDLSVIAGIKTFEDLDAWSDVIETPRVPRLR